MKHFIKQPLGYNPGNAPFHYAVKRQRFKGPKRTFPVHNRQLTLSEILSITGYSASKFWRMKARTLLSIEQIVDKALKEREAL